MNLVYALQDPRTKEIRYIGKSTKGLKRPKYHLLPCYYANKKHDKIPLYLWIRKLARLGLKPEILILQEIDTAQNLAKAELYWIDYFKFQGSPLTNVLDASSMGNLGFKFSLEQRQNMSKARKGHKKSDSWKALVKQAWKQNPKRNSNKKFRDAVSNGTKNWWKNLCKEKKQACKKNLIGGGHNRVSIKDSLGNIFPSYKAAAYFHNCTDGAIRHCIRKNSALRKTVKFEVV